MTTEALVRSKDLARPFAIRTAFMYIAIAVIFAGIALRFSFLDRKLFSYDEATTSIRVAGYTLAEFYHNAFDGEPIRSADFLRYQHVDGQHSMREAVDSLAVEDPQHPPLFYVLERGWQQAFGNAIAQRRAVAAIAGSLALVAVVWFGFELTGGLLAGLAFAALNAVSPFFVIYAQQAREYSLWCLCCAVSSALLLRALRRGGWLLWIGYAVATSAALYTDLLYMFVLLAHAVYVGTMSLGAGRLRRAKAFLIAAAAGFAAFVPWLIAVERGRALLTNNDYLSVPVPLKTFALKWLFNMGAVFFDLDYREIALGAVLLPLVAFLIYALIDLVRRQPKRIWIFVIAMIACSTLFMIVPDIVSHTSRSTAARYLVPAWLMLELIVALVLTRWMNANPKRQTVALTVFVALLACGLASISADMPAQTTWAEGKSIAGLGPIAQIVNHAARPLIVYVNDPQRFDFAMLALSNELDPTVRIEQRSYEPALSLLADDGTVFVLDPTSRVREALRHAGLQLQPAYMDTDHAPLAIRSLRAETASVRSAHGVDEDGLALWKIEVNDVHRP